MLHKVDALRQKMKEEKIDAYIVPSFDPHQSEYVAEYFKKRQWLTGFTGSAGTALVTHEHALLWTDGRYHTQAESQLAGSPFDLIREGLAGQPSIEEWLVAHLPNEATVGFDGGSFSQSSLDLLREKTESRGFSYAFQSCLLEQLWRDRPAFPDDLVKDFPVQFAGEDRKSKLNRVREIMKGLETDLYIVPNLDSIAWVMNLRGSDTPNCPFFIAYLVISLDSATLFIHQQKMPQQLKAVLEADGITIMPYESIFNHIKSCSKQSILIDKEMVSARLFESLPADSAVVAKRDLITQMKAVKSQAELANIHNSQVKDGVAMVFFIDWLEQAFAKGDRITELDVERQLIRLRSMQPHFIGPSFDTIAAYKANAAMMHYKATTEHHAVLKPEGFLLVDSGGQYWDGTTDITRTIPLGPLTQEERLDYTLTLKAHIGLTLAIFLEGTCGPHIDVLARRHMWNHALDYKCGTGHGLGYAMSVHEGPHRIRNNMNDVPLEPGMLVTNEPGVYKPRRHGIRIENTLCVVAHRENECGRFFRFETISFCPIDTTPIIYDLLTHEERAWLNTYHQRVYEVLSPYLEGHTLEKLERWTRPI